MSKEKSDFRKFYYFFGVQLNLYRRQYEGSCPFCNKENHFFVRPDNGLFKCHHCQTEGNNYTFLQTLHKQHNNRHQNKLQELATNRGIKLSTLQDLKVIFYPNLNCWFIPAYSQKQSIVNLYRVTREEEKLRVLSSPYPCTQQLFLSNLVNKQHTKILACEGHWDAIVAYEILLHLQQRNNRLILKGLPDKKNSLAATIGVVGLPGATTLKEPWLTYFSQKDLIGIYDNDPAGELGFRKLQKMLGSSTRKPTSLSRVNWKPDDPNDLRDLKHGRSYLGTWNEVLARLGEISIKDTLKNGDNLIDPDTPLIEPIPCQTITELRKHYQQHLELTQEIDATLITMLSVVLSTKCPGGQLGLRVIGPPGTAKSTLSESISACLELVYPLSKFTGLVSGWGQVNSSNQIGNKINGKCLMIKDADTIIQLPNLAQVESEIRDALGDGMIRAEYKTGRVINIRTLFTMVMCGTRVLRKMDNALLGSRFIDIVIHDPETDTRPIVGAALDSQFSTLQNFFSGKEKNRLQNKRAVEELAPPTYGFLQYKAEILANPEQHNLSLQEPTERQKAQIHAMAEIISYCRARVERDRGEIQYRPERELPTRLAEYLSRLAGFIAFCLSRSNNVRITQQTILLLQRITRDTCFGFFFDCIQAIAKSGTNGITRVQLAAQLRLSESQVYKILQDLTELQILTFRRIPNPHGRGSMTHYYLLKPEVAKTYTTAFARR